MSRHALALGPLAWVVVACATRSVASPGAATTPDETFVTSAHPLRATAAGASPARPLPPPPIRDGRVLELGVGARGVCAILGDRTVRCRAGVGGPVVGRAVPPARDLVVGGDRGCVHDDEGATWCWGHAWWCGAGERLDPELPARVDSLPRNAAVALPPERLRDSGAGLMARTEEGLVRGLWCGDEQPAALTEFGGPVRQLSLGRSTACALLLDGGLRCREDLGPLQAVVGVSAPRAVAVGVGYACALGGDGGAACWPVCEYREGDGGRGTACGFWEPHGRVRRVVDRVDAGFEVDPVDARPSPDVQALPVAEVGGLTAIAVGAGYACGVTGDRGLVCWTFPPAPRHRPRSRSRRPRLHTGTPYRVANLSDVVRVTAEGETLCALRADATMWCGAPTEAGATLAQVRWE